MALSLPEILDRIFIHLPSRLENSPRIEDDWRRDKTDLFSCSLVCREWKDEVRRHIFHTITYSFNCVHATVGHYWTIERALQKFIEFLRSSPDICRLVRRLNLICDMHAVDARVDWKDVYSIIELLQNVEWVMLHMSRCTVLSLSHLLFDSRSPLWTSVVGIDHVLESPLLSSRLSTCSQASTLYVSLALPSLMTSPWQRQPSPPRVWLHWPSTFTTIRHCCSASTRST